MRAMLPVKTETRSGNGLPESRRSAAGSRWKAAAEAVESGAEDSSPAVKEEQSGRRAVSEGKVGM